ncbi:hypothetical protein ASA1KI_40640 [Opitutales bacterium ASA1]|nr:hypothetical protein ASA1KI_40640 [Opitutales bacterium ASA1]
MLPRMVVTPRLRVVVFLVLATGLCLVFAGLARAATGASLDARATWSIELSAVPHARAGQVLRTAERLAGTPAFWQDEHGRGYVLHPDGNGGGFLVVPEQRAGEVLRLRPGVGPKPADMFVSVETAGDDLVVTSNGRRVLGAALEARLPEGADPAYLRGGFVFPFFTPQGVPVIDAFPSDHVHHVGIWTAWTDTSYRGSALDFWNLRKRQGRVEFERLIDATSGSGRGGFTTLLRATDIRDGASRDVLEERWRVSVHALPDAAWHAFDLDVLQINVSDAPLELNEYRYGGLGVRGHGQWNGAGNARFLTSEGETDREKAHATRMRWCWMGGSVDGKTAGIAILGHPENYWAPQPARVHPTEPFFCFAPVQLGAFAIAPGESHRMRFRFVAIDGEPDAELLDALWAGYAADDALVVQSGR